MIYHELDFFILISILKKDTSTWKIAKEYEWEYIKCFKIKKDEEKFYNNKDMIIRTRLKKMVCENIMKEKVRKGKHSYLVDTERVRFNKRYKFPESFGKAILIKEKDKKWQIFQI